MYAYRWIDKQKYNSFNYNNIILILIVILSVLLDALYSSVQYHVFQVARMEGHALKVMFAHVLKAIWAVIALHKVRVLHPLLRTCTVCRLALCNSILSSPWDTSTDSNTTVHIVLLFHM